MKTNIVIDILPPVSYLVKFWVPSYEPKCCQPIKWQDYLKCNISRKKGMMKCTFGMKINNKVFYKLILSFWVCVTRYTKSTQNKFAYFSNISRKAWEMKLIFHLQMNRSFLQVVSITLGNLAQYAQSTQNNKFTVSFQYRKENVKDEVDSWSTSKVSS